MKIAIPSILLVSSLASQAAYTLTNGDFATNDTTGWTTTGTVSAASGAAVVSANSSLTQDFSNGGTATASNFDFQLDFSLAMGTVGSNASRIRLRGNANAEDIVTLRLATNNTSIETFNTATNSWATALSGFTAITANTPFWLRITGTDWDLATRSYTIGYSTTGSPGSYTTSAAITIFHSAPFNTDFETITFNPLAGQTMTVDNVTIVPEPASALLGGLGLLALLRRRRA